MEKEKFKNIESFFPLVEKVIRKYRNSGVELDDLRQQGMLGLLEALEVFDPSKGKAIFSFVFKYIDGSIKHYLRDKASIIRHPRWFKALSRRIENFILEFKEKNGRGPTVEEISEHLNIQEEGIREFFRLKKLLYLQSLEEGEGSLNTDYNRLRAKIKHKVYESFKLPIEDVLTLYIAIDKLSDLKKKVIYYIFFQGYTQKETAEKVGISQRHVSRVKKEALQELKERLKE